MICASVMAETTEQTVASIKKAENADLIEIRLDYRKEQLDLAAIRASTDKPLIATNRRKDQGGKAEEPEDARLKLLEKAVEAGFEYVDIASTTENLKDAVSSLQSLGAKVIASHHDFNNPLNAEQIEVLHRALSETGCEVVKIVGWTTSDDDIVPYLEYNRHHPGNLSFGMGEKGAKSRILAPLAGALFTYASLEEGSELAPGQIPLTTLSELYRSLEQ
jgi:3-dehydroquinate dehydratase type I